MIDCLILGDQIAEGLTDYMSGCVPFTVPAITSWDFSSRYYYNNLIFNNQWDTVIISLGVNDDKGSLRSTKVALQDFRHGIKSKHVFWILPPEHMWDLRKVVHDVAMGRQDGLIDVPGWNKSSPSVWGFRDMASKLNK